jgi:hypothetical protein
MHSQARTPNLSAPTATFPARRVSKGLCQSLLAIALLIGLGFTALGLLRAEMAKTWHALPVCQQTTPGDLVGEVT